MADSTAADVYKTLTARMTGLGLSFGDFVALEDVIDGWSTNPAGFHFRSSNLASLRVAVEKNAHFGREHWMFEKAARLSGPSCAFREAGKNGSLHIILRFDDKSVVHLDSISIVEARDSRTGQAIYNDDLAVLIEHHRVDLKHKSCLFYCK